MIGQGRNGVSNPPRLDHFLSGHRDQTTTQHSAFSTSSELPDLPRLVGLQSPIKACYQPVMTFRDAGNGGISSPGKLRWNSFPNFYCSLIRTLHKRASSDMPDLDTRFSNSLYRIASQSSAFRLTRLHGLE